MSWRDEIGTALEAWIAALGGSQGGERWQRVGTARPTREPGAYAVDIRGSDLTADQADNLRLAGPEKRSIRDGFPVLEATVDGELLRVRVAEFAAPAEPCVWRLRQQPTFLVTALRDELAALTDAGLANLLARGEVGGAPAAVNPPPGLLPAQQDVYRACLGSGLWLVWGPPGTGKTRLLRAAVSDLAAAGKRVLLVSGTNIAVDNALLGVVRECRHRPGEIVRVGPPQLREIADDPQVCLPLIVRARLAEVEGQRRAAAIDLLDMDRRQERWHDPETRLAGFDAAAYEKAAALLTNQGPVAETSHALAQCNLLAGNGLRTIEEARNECDAATISAAEASTARGLWAEIDSKEAELAKVEEAALQAETRALVAENAYMAAQDEIAALQQQHAGRGSSRQYASGRITPRRAPCLRPSEKAAIRDRQQVSPEKNRRSGIRSGRLVRRQCDTERSFWLAETAGTGLRQEKEKGCSAGICACLARLCLMSADPDALVALMPFAQHLGLVVDHASPDRVTARLARVPGPARECW